MGTQGFKDRYASILKAFTEYEEERYLAEAAELGRELVLANVWPEDIAEIHEEGIKNLAKDCPGKTLLESANRISAPLMEMLMAYGLAFREWLDEQSRAEQKLLDYQSRLKRMAAELMHAEDHERRRIATGMHDEICQKLVMSKLVLESSLQLIPDANVASSLKTVSESIGKVIQEADSLTFSLSSPILHELGFVAAMKEYLNEQIRKKHGIAVKFESDAQSGALEEETKNLLFRISRELLTNVVKHAHARNVKVSVHESDGCLWMGIQDDGVGFNETEAVSKKTRFGLFSVREQLEHLGGCLELESEVGRGTTASIVIPLKELATSQM